MIKTLQNCGTCKYWSPSIKINGMRVGTCPYIKGVYTIRIFKDCVSYEVANGKG